VFELDVRGVWARTDVLMTLTLRSADGALVHREERLLTGGVPSAVALSWPEGRPAAELSLVLESRTAGPTRVLLHDLRVQGQSPRLAAYVRQLPFPPLDGSGR
jgi:hypothetical protein